MQIINFIRKLRRQNDSELFGHSHRNLEKLIEQNLQEMSSSFLDPKYINSGDNLLEDIANQVRVDGFILLKNIISAEYIASFRREFDSIISSSSETKYQVDRHEGSTCVRVKPLKTLNKNKYPLIVDFFEMEIFKRISEYFYNIDRKKISVNDELFLHETPVTKAPLSGTMHWDRAQTLKFWVYIDDLPLDAGPMAIDKGSSDLNRTERIKSSSVKKKLIGGVDNIAKVLPETNVVYLNGPAGSILIHDTDASHGATTVSPGFTRRIIRGHTRLKK